MTSFEKPPRQGPSPFSFAVVLGALMIPFAASPSFAATKTTRKATAKTASKTVAARSSQNEVSSGTSNDTGNTTGSPVLPTAKPTTTTAPPPRSSGTPIKGWDQIKTDEWPARGDSVIAVAIGRSLEVLRAPGDRTGALRLEQGRSMYGAIRLIGLGTKDGWVRVGVPIRPNGTAGWVKASDVRLQRNFAHIQIELSSNTMRVYDGDRISIETKVAAGTGGTPTPTGLFFVKELVPQPNPNGALGPFAFGLSGFSTVLSSFANGEGTIGIHGTNAPNKIGGDVSHGCVRVTNTNVVAMTKIVPLGTPVEIVQSWNDVAANRRTSDWVDQVGAPSGPLLAPSPGPADEINTTTTTATASASTSPTTTSLEAATIPVAGTS
jgi:L,D-transpeptidase catalytic domain